jgi:adenylate cyclase
MTIEIERKFLVRSDKLPELTQGVRIEQAYIPTGNGSTVRVRLAGDQAFIAVKGRASNLSRREYEFAIPVADATEMLGTVCAEARVEKRRYLLEHAGLTWEVDVFEGANEGLLVAEVELDTEDQFVELPEWVGDEVSLDRRYSNYSLALYPYNNWT